jgi:hypothetical protein
MASAPAWQPSRELLKIAVATAAVTGASQLPQQLSFRQLDDVQNLMIFGIF